MRSSQVRFSLTAVPLLALALVAGAAGASEDIGKGSFLYGRLTKVLETQKTGTKIEWANPATGNKGFIQITSTDPSVPGKPCRDYVRVLENESGAPEVTQGRGCRQDGGIWTIEEKPGAEKAKTAAGEKASPKPGAAAEAPEAAEPAEIDFASVLPLRKPKQLLPEAKIPSKIPTRSEEWEAFSYDG